MPNLGGLGGFNTPTPTQSWSQPWMVPGAASIPTTMKTGSGSVTTPPMPAQLLQSSNPMLGFNVSFDANGSPTFTSNSGGLGPGWESVYDPSLTGVSLNDPQAFTGQRTTLPASSGRGGFYQPVPGAGTLGGGVPGATSRTTNPYIPVGTPAATPLDVSALTGDLWGTGPSAGGGQLSPLNLTTPAPVSPSLAPAPTATGAPDPNANAMWTNILGAVKNAVATGGAAAPATTSTAPSTTTAASPNWWDGLMQRATPAGTQAALSALSNAGIQGKVATGYDDTNSFFPGTTGKTQIDTGGSGFQNAGLVANAQKLYGDPSSALYNPSYLNDLLRSIQATTTTNAAWVPTGAATTPNQGWNLGTPQTAAQQAAVQAQRPVQQPASAPTTASGGSWGNWGGWNPGRTSGWNVGASNPWSYVAPQFNTSYSRQRQPLGYTAWNRQTTQAPNTGGWSNGAGGFYGTPAGANYSALGGGLGSFANLLGFGGTAMNGLQNLYGGARVNTGQYTGGGVNPQITALLSLLGGGYSGY